LHESELTDTISLNVNRISNLTDTSKNSDVTKIRIKITDKLEQIGNIVEGGAIFANSKALADLDMTVEKA
jgi:hypothetical protein